MYIPTLSVAELEAAIRGYNFLVSIGMRDHQTQPTPTPKPVPPSDRIGGVSLAVEITGFAKQTIYNMSSSQLIPHSKRGRKLMFSETELRSWLFENKRPMAGQEAAMADQFIVKPKTRRKKGGAQ